ncbi:hypothetical protein H072_1408 [Dactylellina haptotyla CBS 200.50]|uniref:F-box domain-containing protein n=1 Tax=Dactylellina haptotyla (strain CBS 200.50) TaxID=1284197 RepID=S8AUE6_DACHA|nr:hypothetical protein H072_1408 [Dactylellina haptotyla CBS 200.50]
MATTTIDQPGPLIQWPQYEKPNNPLASSSFSCNSALSELEHPAENSLINKCASSSDTVGVIGAGRPPHPMTTSVDTKCRRIVQTPSIATPDTNRSLKMGRARSDGNARYIKGVFSRLSSRIFAVGKQKNASTDLTKQESESAQYLRRCSLQSDKPLATCNREVVSGSGLRRSWLFDKKMIPVVALETTPKERPSAGSLFFRLPVELRLEIVTKLIYSDIISLRKASRSFNDLIVSNEHEITRRQIQVFIEPRYTILYPPDSPTKPTFAYLSKLATKSIAASELSRALVTQLYDEFQDKYFEPHSSDAKPLIVRYMTERLRFSIMVIQHFLEQFAERKLRHDRHNGYASRADDIQLQEAIMEKYYTSEQLIEASDFYRLTLYLLWQNVSVCGANERMKRIWAILTDTLPAVQDITKFMIVGGVPALRNVYRNRKPASRRKAMARFSTLYKSEQARATNVGATLLPRVYQPPENMRRYSKLAISPNIFHLWIHPAQNVLFRNDLIDGLNQFRCIDDIVGTLLEGWEEWAYGTQEDAESDSDDDTEDGDEISEISVPPTRDSCGISVDS